jgi:hypothetical protein
MTGMDDLRVLTLKMPRAAANLGNCGAFHCARFAAEGQSPRNNTETEAGKFFPVRQTRTIRVHPRSSVARVNFTAA